MSQVIEFLPPTWGTCTEFLPPIFDARLSQNVTGVWAVKQQIEVVSLFEH